MTTGVWWSADKKKPTANVITTPSTNPTLTSTPAPIVATPSTSAPQTPPRAPIDKTMSSPAIKVPSPKTTVPYQKSVSTKELGSIKQLPGEFHIES